MYARHTHLSQRADRVGRGAGGMRFGVHLRDHYRSWCSAGDYAGYRLVNHERPATERRTRSVRYYLIGAEAVSRSRRSDPTHADAAASDTATTSRRRIAHGTCATSRQMMNYSDPAMMRHEDRPHERNDRVGR